MKTRMKITRYAIRENKLSAIWYLHLKITINYITYIEVTNQII